MLWLYWLYAMAFAFDFRGEEGGSSVQFLFLGITLAAGSVILWAGRRSLFVVPTAYLLTAWLIYVASTPIVALSNGVNMGNYIRCCLPVVLCSLSMLVMQAMTGFGFRPKALLNPLLVAGSISIIWRAIYALYVKRIAIDDIRYELLSPAAPLFIAYFMTALFFSRRRFPWEAFTVGGIAFGSLFISVTRSYIVTAGVAFLACAVLLQRSLAWRQWTGAEIGRKSLQTFVLIVSAGALFIGIAISNPKILDRWTSRLFDNAGSGKETSIDITLMTRLAEASTMMKKLKNHPENYAHGLGMGMTYNWDEDYAKELLIVYPDRSATSEEFFFPGHSTWVYAMFSGGVFGVLSYAGLMAGSLLLAYSSARAYARAGYPASDVIYLPFVIHLCYLSQSFTANPFGDRFAGVIIGLMACLPQAVFNALPQTRSVTPGPSASTALQTA